MRDEHVGAKTVAPRTSSITLSKFIYFCHIVVLTLVSVVTFTRPTEVTKTRGASGSLQNILNRGKGKIDK